ncbi:phage tail protein [Falsiroseomonas sp.]|uniref:phage tail protein n=1 Tax=Falsiroseomonas sp. TaxID=2870721 RepID=UPI003F700455
MTAVGAIAAYATSALMNHVTGANKKRSAGGLTIDAQDRTQSIRQAVGPRRMVYGRARVGGTLVYVASSSRKVEDLPTNIFGQPQGADDLRYLHLVTVLAGHVIDGVEGVYINDQIVYRSELDGDGMVSNDASPFKGKVRIRIYDGRQTTADRFLMAESPDGWSADHKLLGCAYLYVRLEYDPGVFQGGLQNIAALVRGKADIWDPRTGASGYTTNWALCVLDYLRSPMGMACGDDEIDLPSFIAAANLSDEKVPIDILVFQPRYTCDTTFTVDRTRREILGDMLTGGAGVLPYVKGRYRLEGAAYTAPTATLTVSDIAGPVKVTTRPPLRDLYNGVKGTFIDPSKGWQAAEFPAVTAPVYEAEDGERLWREIELPVTIDPIRAQRLAKLELLRGRDALSIEVPLQYRAFRFAVRQVLSVTIDYLGLAAKPMRIIEWSFTKSAGTVNVVLKEDNAASYAWFFFDATVPAPVPDTTLVSPYNVPAPAGLAMAEELYVTRAGTGVRTRAILSWSPAAHPFVVGYDVQYRAAGEEWRTAAGTAGETSTIIQDLAEGAYEWRVRARTGLAGGTWATLAAPIGGLAAQPPAPITGLGIQTIGGVAFLAWDQHPDLDVLVGGRIEIRHTPSTSGAVWAGATSIGTALPGTSAFATLPLKPGTYLVKAVDAGGRYGDQAAAISTDAATALAFANLATLTEHAAFSGAKTGTVVVSGTLRLGSGGDVDGVSDWDSVPDLDGLGGVAAAGSYAFSGGMDLGAVKAVRLTSRIRATVVNQLDQIDGRAAPIDDWTDFDGAAGGEADAWVECRTTPDNPAGTPTWSDWRRVDQAEVTARGIQWRAQLRSFDPAFNIHVAELSATADEVV